MKKYCNVYSLTTETRESQGAVSTKLINKGTVTWSKQGVPAELGMVYEPFKQCVYKITASYKYRCIAPIR